VFVTLQDTGGDFGLAGRAGARAWSGGLAGLAKTAAAEWPEASAKAIDVERDGASPEAVAAKVVEELLLGGTDLEVGLEGGGKRTVIRNVSAPYTAASAGESMLRQGTVVIVSGGARGVTATSLQAICKHGPHLALLGRTALVDEPEETRGAATDADIRRVLLMRAKAAGANVLPKELAREAKLILDCREIRGNMDALGRAGAKVSYHAVDVRSAAAVAGVVDAIRKAFGPIGAIVHGAGVLADALIGAQTDEQLDLVFGTKVDGLHHLLDATKSDPVETLIVFSSVAGRFGNSAQSAYSMANDVLSAVAAGERARRGGRCVVRSLAWGPWAGGMVTPGLAKLFEKAGVQLIALDAGAAALGLEMAAPDAYPQVVLMNGAPPAPGMPLHGGKAPAADARFDLRVRSSTHPLLDGHRIKGAAVIPAVMVASLFARTARAHRPAQLAVACRDIRVLRGIPVDAYDQDGMRLSVRLHEISATSFEMKLVDEQDRPRYAAVVDVAPAYLAASGVPKPPEPPADGKAWPFSVDQAYENVLFHRGPFATVKRLDLVSETGASGEVAGIASAASGDWFDDVTLLDGGVQVAALWGTHLLGRLPLPTRIGAFHIHRGGPAGARVRCVVRGQRAGQHHVVADLAFITEGGDVLGTMTKIDFHLPPVATRGPGASH
jgi:NAD(P)-dependent dehydrogenase (short-subunit alcohol dehydrogenase family)